MLKSTKYANIEIAINYVILIVAGLLLVSAASCSPVVFVIAFIVCAYEAFHISHLTDELDGELKTYIDKETGEVRRLMTYGRVK